MSIIHGQTQSRKEAVPILCDDQGRVITTSGGSNTGNDAPLQPGALAQNEFSAFPENISEVGLLKTLVLTLSGKYEVTRDASTVLLTDSTPASTLVPALPFTEQAVIGVCGTLRPSTMDVQTPRISIFCGGALVLSYRVTESSSFNFDFEIPIKNKWDVIIEPALTGSAQISIGFIRWIRQATLTNLDPGT